MAVVATGFFDGVHLGHMEVIKTLLGLSKAGGGQSLVVTFSSHPRLVLQEDARRLRMLTSLEEKRGLLEAAGVDRVEVLEFTREFAAMSAGRYISEVLMGRFKASTLVLGYDNRLGCDQLGPAGIVPLAASMGLKTVVVEPLEGIHGAVSSTRIRLALDEGRVDDAALMLGRRYRLPGIVVHGNGLGRTIGFPTANVKPAWPLKAIPAPGVYATVARLLGREYGSMTNIDAAGKIETHIFGFDEDVYGLDISVEFVCRERGEMEFGCLEELRPQLETDRKNILLSLRELWKTS